MREKLYWSRHPTNEEFENLMEEVVYSGDIVLDVGCGSYKIHPSLLGVDAYADTPNINLKAYMWDMPFAENSVDGLFCMMALEHISKFQIIPTLIEFNRVVKKGAKFIILVPDFIWILQEFIKNPNVDWEMDMIFGTQAHEGEFHKTGFTETIIRKYFAEAIPNCTFIIYKVIAYNQSCFGIVAEKG